MDLTDFVYSPAMLVVTIFGLVEFVKQLGVEGNKLRLWSLGLGVGLAALFKLPELVPQFAPYIEVVFFGLVGGLTASGVYGFLNERLPKL